MKQILYLIIGLIGFSVTASAQTEPADGIPWSVNEGTLIGIGGYNLKDTYLSPSADGVHYSGWGLRAINERMKMTRLADDNVSRQHLFSVDIAFADNPAGTASEFAVFGEYSLGYHYHFRLLPNLKLLAGSAIHGMGGFIYNARNSNNPASAHLDIDLNASGMAIYNLKIKNYPLTFRYQLDIPFAGILFSPQMGQSYYEMFDQGNTSDIVRFNSFHNKFAMRNYLTVDFPVHNWTVRMGYLNSYYHTDVNNIQTRILSNTFMLGLVKEFISFSGKRLKQTNKYRSAYY